MDKHYTYFLILAASLVGPLALSFDKKVAFHKKWYYVFRAMLLPALFYIIWDIIFTRLNIWHFNPAYITGYKIINLPVEEVLFFFVVPYCCLFIYECVCCYLPKLHINSADLILKLLAAILLIAGLIFINKSYTSCTFIFTSVFIGSLFIENKLIKSFNSTRFVITYIIILIPFLIVNGFLTSIPVVIYDNTQNLAIRIYTIPIEDIFYGMLLTLLNILIYDRLKTKDIAKVSAVIN